MKRAAEWVTSETCVEMLVGASKLGITELASACEKFIVDHFEAIASKYSLAEGGMIPEPKTLGEAISSCNQRLHTRQR
jgi:hypothetical protein